MKQECFVNRNKVLAYFRRAFGVTGDVIDPMYFSDMCGSHKQLRIAWDEACELDRKWYVEQEIVRNTCMFVTRDNKHNVVKLSIAIHGGWDEYEGADAQRKYDAVKYPYNMAIYND